MPKLFIRFHNAISIILNICAKVWSKLLKEWKWFIIKLGLLCKDCSIYSPIEITQLNRSTIIIALNMTEYLELGLLVLQNYIMVFGEVTDSFKPLSWDLFNIALKFMRKFWIMRSYFLYINTVKLLFSRSYNTAVFLLLFMPSLCP